MKRKIIIFGSNTLAVELTRYCFNHPGIEILAVRPEPNDPGEDGWQKSLLKFCLEFNLSLLKNNNFKDPACVEEIKSLQPDFIFSLQCRSIIPKSIIQIPRYHIINFHPAPLPKYRGMYTCGWVLLNGEKETGVTIHLIDAGVDTGDILFQEKISILPSDTARSLLDKINKVGIKLFKKKLNNILSLNFKPVKQDSRRAIYYSIHSIDFTKNFINWNQNVEMVNNFMRAFICPPYQYPQSRYKKFVFGIGRHSISRYSYTKAQPGTVVDLSDEWLKVAVFDGYVYLRQLIFDGKEVKISELVSLINLKKGGLLYL